MESNMIGAEQISQPTVQESANNATKFCKHCGAVIPQQAVICTACGGQVEQMQTTPQNMPNIVVNNVNTNTNVNTNRNTNYRASSGGGRIAKNKWVAFCLCLFLGYFGVHKFYEGNTKMGLIYLCTFGLFGIGWMVDCILLLCKPNPYYV